MAETQPEVAGASPQWIGLKIPGVSDQEVCLPESEAGGSGNGSDRDHRPSVNSIDESLFGGANNPLTIPDPDGKPDVAAQRRSTRLADLLADLSDLVEEVKAEVQKDGYELRSPSRERPNPAKHYKPTEDMNDDYEDEGAPSGEESPGEDEDVRQSVNVDGVRVSQLDRSSSTSNVPLPKFSGKPEMLEKYRKSHLIRSSSMLNTAKKTEFHDTWKVEPEIKPSMKSTQAMTHTGSFSQTVKRTFTSVSSDDSRVSNETFMILPQSNRKLVWDVIGLCIIGFEIIYLPLQLFNKEETKLTVASTILSIVYWSTDVVFCFFTAYYTPNGELEKRRTYIVKHYVKSWFILDVVCVVIDILSLLAQAAKASSGFLRGMKIIKFFRMIRILKVSGRLESSEDRIRSEMSLIMIRLWKLFLVLFFVCHCLACGWWAIGKHYNRSKFNWIDDALPQGSVRERSFGYRYSVCFHWAMSQFVASAEIFPTNTAERGYAVLAACIALIGFGSMIAGMTSSIVEITDKRNKDAQKELRLRKFLEQHDVSGKLRAKIWSYVRAARKSQVQSLSVNQVQLLQSFPRSMMQDICVEVYLPVMTAHPMYNVLVPRMPRAVRKLANTGMSEDALGIGKELFLTGEVGETMFFLTKGKLSYNFIPIEYEQAERNNSARSSDATAQGSQASSYNPPAAGNDCVVSFTLTPTGEVSWACELALYVKWRHTGIMEAPEVAEFVRLDSTEFCKCMRKEIDVHRYAQALIQMLRSFPWQNSDVMQDSNALAELVFEVRSGFGN